MMLSDAELAAIRDRHEQTYAGPWRDNEEETGWHTITARSVGVARYVSAMNARWMVSAHRDVPLLLDEIVWARQQLADQCENVITLRAMNEDAFTAGARWALRGLPIDFTRNAATTGYERWLEQMTGEMQSVVVQSGDTPDIWGYEGDG